MVSESQQISPPIFSTVLVTFSHLFSVYITQIDVSAKPDSRSQGILGGAGEGFSGSNCPHPYFEYVFAL